MKIKMIRCFLGSILFPKKKKHYLKKIQSLLQQDIVGVTYSPEAKITMPDLSGKNSYLCIQNMNHDAGGNNVFISEELQNSVFLHIKGYSNIIKATGKSHEGTINITIEGNDNTVYLEDCSVGGICSISMRCNNSLTHLRNVGIIQRLDITNGSTINGIKSSNSSVIIERGTSCESLNIWNHHSNAGVFIDKNCMISYDVVIQNSDTHPIFDKNTQEIINKPKNKIHIGEHTWLGRTVTILKGVSIPSNTIVGSCAVVSKSFSESHTALGGNPAKVIKKDVTWDIYNDTFNL